MNTYHYECRNCITEFIAENILYCPFCSSFLYLRGLAERSTRDYVAAGWNVVVFRSKSPGIAVRNVTKGKEMAGMLASGCLSAKVFDGRRDRRNQ